MAERPVAGPPGTTGGADVGIGGEDIGTGGEEVGTGSGAGTAGGEDVGITGGAEAAGALPAGAPPETGPPAGYSPAGRSGGSRRRVRSIVAAGGCVGVGRGGTCATARAPRLVACSIRARAPSVRPGSRTSPRLI
jgi:peptide/nickel transport system ATP-binding protein